LSNPSEVTKHELARCNIALRIGVEEHPGHNDFAKLDVRYKYQLLHFQKQSCTVVIAMKAQGGDGSKVVTSSTNMEKS